MRDEGFVSVRTVGVSFFFFWGGGEYVPYNTYDITHPGTTFRADFLPTARLEGKTTIAALKSSRHVSVDCVAQRFYTVPVIERLQLRNSSEDVPYPHHPCDTVSSAVVS